MASKFATEWDNTFATALLYIANDIITKQPRMILTIYCEVSLLALNKLDAALIGDDTKPTTSAPMNVLGTTPGKFLWSY